MRRLLACFLILCCSVASADEVLSVFRNTDGVVQYQLVDMVKGGKRPLPLNKPVAIAAVFLNSSVGTGDIPKPPSGPDDPTPVPPTDDLVKAIQALCSTHLKSNDDSAALIAVMNQILDWGMNAGDNQKFLDMAIPEVATKMKNSQGITDWYAGLKDLSSGNVSADFLKKTITALEGYSGLTVARVMDAANQVQQASKLLNASPEKVAAMLDESERVFDIALILEIIRIIKAIFDIFQGLGMEQALPPQYVADFNEAKDAVDRILLMLEGSKR